jgi:uncharacterized damage-inducible protein DinB
MEKFFEEYLVILEKCHDNVLRAVEGLSGPALDWQPGTDMNSIAVLIYHLTGAERFWTGDVVDQTPSGRDREAEFKVRDIGLEVLKRRLDESLDHARRAVEKLSLSDLPQTRATPDGRTFTVAWALLHVIEHSSLHLGHIEMTRQMWQAAQVSD